VIGWTASSTLSYFEVIIQSTCIIIIFLLEHH